MQIEITGNWDLLATMKLRERSNYGNYAYNKEHRPTGGQSQKKKTLLSQSRENFHCKTSSQIKDSVCHTIVE